MTPAAKSGGDERQLLLAAALAAFNARDIDAALALMDPQIDWQDGVEAGRPQGHAGLRDYWTRQWQRLDPRVEPTCFSPREDGSMAVTVQQVVRDRSGTTLREEQLSCVYTFRDGLIASISIA
ncbi:MAG TPA: nuclear transport factor 2 family protein [Solirubrobacterales bacterium]|jgi:hypothetical protein